MVTNTGMNLTDKIASFIYGFGGIVPPPVPGFSISFSSSGMMFCFIIALIKVMIFFVNLHNIYSCRVYTF